MEVVARPLDLFPRHLFTIARGSKRKAKNVVVEVREGALAGWGEAAPSAYYRQSRRLCLAVLRRMAPALARASLATFGSLLDGLARSFPGQTDALSALDIALHDLYAKKLGVPLYALWGLDPLAAPRTSFTIGLDTPERMLAKVEEAAPWPILKIKLGRRGDMEILREIRKKCPGKVIRVDANGGWDLRGALRRARTLEELGVEFVEQPLPAGAIGGLRVLRRKTGLTIFADESSRTPSDLPALIGAVHGINIKLLKCGGLRPAMAMISAARACGFKIMAGCMLQSSLSVTAAAHLTPLVDYADLDGPWLLARDPFEGIKAGPQGQLLLPSKPGLGVCPRSQKSSLVQFKSKRRPDLSSI